MPIRGAATANTKTRQSVAKSLREKRVNGKEKAFIYKARVQTRKGVKAFELEAPNETIARKRASRDGRLINIKKKGRSRTLSNTMSVNDRQVFLGRLAAMLGSGIGAGEALSLLKITFKGTIQRASNRLLDRMELGDTLPMAIQHLGPKMIPPTTAAMIQAGSHTGATHEALRGALEFERTMNEVKRNSGKGIWYAMLSFMFAIVFMLGTIFGFLPYILDSPMMAAAGNDSGGILGPSIQFSYATGYVMGALFAVFMVFILMGTVGRKIAPTAMDRLILKIPIYKDVVLAKTNFIAFYALSLLVKNGVSMEEALTLMAENTERGALKTDFTKACSAVRRGQQWHVEFSALDPTDRAALGASLDREQISNAMNEISIQYRQLYAARMSSLVPVLQGISALFLMLAGLLMFAVTILPMLEMSTAILG
nr:type II secretion system F family protein [uncultured Halomonas sp.]